jgi:hypothetical protein
VIQFQQSAQPTGRGLQFSWKSLGTPAAWVDVHYANALGAPVTSMNVRMTSPDGGLTWMHTDNNLQAGKLVLIPFFLIVGFLTVAFAGLCFSSRTQILLHVLCERCGLRH